MITVSAHINRPTIDVWVSFTNENHITKWNFAAPEWHCPTAKNDVRKDGTFSYRMEAKDGSFGFDLNGTFTQVSKPTSLHYTLEDGRKVEVDFEAKEDGTLVTQHFEPENQNPEELQKTGWQAILNSFKKHTESL